MCAAWMGVASLPRSLHANSWYRRELPCLLKTPSGFPERAKHNAAAPHSMRAVAWNATTGRSPHPVPRALPEPRLQEEQWPGFACEPGLPSRRLWPHQGDRRTEAARPSRDTTRAGAGGFRAPLKASEKSTNFAGQQAEHPWLTQFPVQRRQFSFVLPVRAGVLTVCATDTRGKHVETGSRRYTMHPQLEKTDQRWNQ